jgi:hypothetical protein
MQRRERSTSRGRITAVTSRIAPSRNGRTGKLLYYERWEERDITPLRLSEFQPAVGRLADLALPDLDAIGLKRRIFYEPFLDLHNVIGKLEREEMTLYYVGEFDCGEPMPVNVLLGYDGPVMWLDGKGLGVRLGRGSQHRG